MIYTKKRRCCKMFGLSLIWILLLIHHVASHRGRMVGRLRREDARLPKEGWSDWKRAMVPARPGRDQHHFKERSSNNPGYRSVDVDHAFDGYDSGIYEWQTRGNKKPSRVVYVGSAARADPGALKARIKEYSLHGSHKKTLMNNALRNGDELWVRAKSTDGVDEARHEENKLLSKYDYAWNKQRNGKRRNI